jgi:hypothetical protein
MKGIIICFLLAFSFNLFGDEIQLEKDGAILWAENCMGCHIPKDFLAADPDREYVDELIETIEFNIFDPESGMNVLSYLKSVEINKIAEFLIYGSHGEKWASQNLHSRSAREFGTDSCLKCHDNDKFYKEPPRTCNVCH